MPSAAETAGSFSDVAKVELCCKIIRFYRVEKGENLKYLQWQQGCQ